MHNIPNRLLVKQLAPRLTRSLSAIETWGFGLSGLLLWLGTAPGMHAELGNQAIWVWLPGAIIGIMLNLQVKRLGYKWQDVSGGTPNYTTRLLKNYPGLASYAAIGYVLGWVSVPPMNAIILTDLIKGNLEPLGIACPVTALKIGFTIIPFFVAFSGTRALSILHLFFMLPAIGFLLLFCTQGLGWLAFSPISPGFLPSDWSVAPVSISVTSWAKWFFVAVYAVYGCETASSFVADSRRPIATLQSLKFAACLLPIVYLAGSWVLLRLSDDPNAGSDAFLNLVAAAKPFWGEAASVLVTFLVASGCLLSSATALSNSPRVLYQMSLDGYLAPVFAVVSRRGVLGPSLAFTGLLSLLCLLWGDVTHVVMVTGTSYLTAMIAIHWGLWLNRKHPESRWAWWSIGFCGLEIAVLVVGGIAWGWQDLLIGLLLPIAILVINAVLPRLKVPVFHPDYWIRFYHAQAYRKTTDLMLIQVSTLILLICGATGIGWLVRGRLSGLMLTNNANLFVVLLMATAFVGVAIACWTSLPQVALVMEARQAAEHLFIVAQDAIVVVDHAGIVRRMNPVAQTLFEQGGVVVGSALNQSLVGLGDRVPHQWRNRSEQTLPHPDGVKTLEVSISDRATSDLHEYVIILRDITERKQAESILQNSEIQLRQKTEELEEALRYVQQTQSKLVQNEKMSSLGQLVAGVAHEINNPVNFIYGNLNHANEYTHDLLRLLYLYQRHYPNPAPEILAETDAIDIDFLAEDLPKLLSSMKVGADRIKNIVTSLRNFSRMDEADIKPVNIHEGIDSTLMILQNRLKARPDHSEIQVVKNYSNLPLVECYAGQLNQVFMNILSNAIDALEEAAENSQQKLNKQQEISAFDSRCATPCIQIHTEQKHDSVLIRIIDNGPGIPTNIQQRLFEPFFTTKPVGKGTGLGLSISYDVITEKHGGQLQCLSAPESGTEFLIAIPLQLRKK